MDYFHQQEEAQIREEYRHSRIQQEVDRQLDTDSKDFKSFYQEAIHNVDTIPGGDELLAEVVKEFGNVTADSHYTATADIIEFYAKWIAAKIVDDEMESMSVDEMQRWSDKKEDVWVNTDTVELEKVE